MSFLGIDTAARISADAAKKLKVLGVSFAGRYLVPPGMNKELTAEEAKGLRDAGLFILLCWEIDAARAGRGAPVGAQDGARARQLAQDMGVPPGTAIFFAVDYCPQRPEYDLIRDYFLAAQAAVAPYRCGIYGCYDVVEAMKAHIPQLLIWQCVGGSGGRVYEGNNFYQRLSSDAAECREIQAQVGFAVDINSAESLDGLWQPPDPEPETHWYDDTMRWGLKEGIITDERPTDYATRAEVVQMIRNYNRRFEAEDTKTASGLLTD